MNKIIDIHCHIDFPITPGMISRARANGVMGIVCNSAIPDDWCHIIGACTDSDFCYGAIGIHPWCATAISDNTLQQLQIALSENPKLMVGEIGIDKHHADIDTQHDLFESQMEIAHTLHRPVQIHCVGAWERVLNTLKHMQNNLPPTIIMHAFYATPEITEQLLRYPNIFFSFSPRVITTSGAHISDTINTIPTHRLLIESDSDTPSDTQRVLKHLSIVRECDINTLSDQIYNNSIKAIHHE